MRANAVQMRTCRRCDQQKPIADFSKHPRSRTGYGWTCVACYRAKNAVYVRTRYHADPKIRQRMREKLKLRRAAGLRTDEKDLVKARARQIFRAAIARGDVVRPNACQDCGITCTPHGHHSDYSLPLAVEWLCRACHSFRHRKYPDALAASRQTTGDESGEGELK